MGEEGTQRSVLEPAGSSEGSGTCQDTGNIGKRQMREDGGHCLTCVHSQAVCAQQVLKKSIKGLKGFHPQRSSSPGVCLEKKRSTVYVQITTLDKNASDKQLLETMEVILRMDRDP